MDREKQASVPRCERRGGKRAVTMVDEEGQALLVDN